MAEHQIVKPEKIVATAAVLLEQNLVVPACFQREGIDAFRGADDDTINVVVEGILPFRTYGWRNDRSTEIQFDEYKERKVAVKFGGDIYSGVLLNDEQYDMDLDGWTKLARKQTEAVGRGLEYEAVDHLKAAPYEVTVGVSVEQLRKGLIEARRVFRALHVPAGEWTMIVGTDWEAALLGDRDLSTAAAVGEQQAVGALADATLFRRYGFNFVVAAEVEPTAAYAMVSSAFIFATGAPKVPQSVPFGATAAYNGVALTWIRDYETTKRRDRSVFNTYKGFRHVPDTLVGRDQSTGQAFQTEEEHFVRAIKLELTDSEADAVAASEYPEAGSELAKVTGLTEREALA